jgi:hypothetical protein
MTIMKITPEMNRVYQKSIEQFISIWSACVQFRGNNEDYITNESCLLGVHWTIQFTSKYMCVSRDNNEDYTRNESCL